MTLDAGIIANLLLARGISRRRDMAIRLALGSTRTRLVVQQLVEAGLLVVIGTVCGLALAAAGDRLVAPLPAISELPFAFVPSVDPRVIVFASALAAACVVLCAAVPALTQSHVDLRSSYAAPRGSYRAVRVYRARSVLVIAEVALGTVVVTAAMLMTKSLIRLQDMNPGVRTDRLLTLRIEPSSGVHTDADARRVFQQILDRLHRLPGVQRVALTGYLPLTDPGRTWRFSIERRASTASGDKYFAVPAEVSREFFGALGIARLAGRLFDGTDGADSPGVAVISQTAARRSWPDERAVGQRIRISGVDRWFTIIGIVADVHQAKLQADPAQALYTPWNQMPYTLRSATVLLQTGGDPLPVVPGVRNVIHAVDATTAIGDVRPMGVVRRRALGESTFRTEMLASFAALAR